MQNIIYIIDTDTNGYTPFGLDFISIISIILTVSVIIIKNPISSVLSLIGLFFSIACYLVILGLSFIGLSYLLVYVGAVSILFLFILMLINVRVSELSANTTNSIPLVILVTIFFIYNFENILPNTSAPDLMFSYKDIMPLLTYIINYMNDPSITYNSIEKINFVTSKSWDGNIAEAAHITSIGNVMYTSYFIWLILTSIILLLAMVGCIVITVKDSADSIQYKGNKSYNRDSAGSADAI